METKTILDLDNKNRVLHSAIVRRGCDDPSSSTWAKWRDIVGVPKGRRFLTCQEAFLLFTISKYTAREIKGRGDALAYANMLIEQRPGSAYMLGCLAGEEGIPGKSVAWVVYLATGRRRSTRTIRRKAKELGIPFSLMENMPAEHVRKISKAIAA